MDAWRESLKGRHRCPINEDGEDSYLPLKAGFDFEPGPSHAHHRAAATLRRPQTDRFGQGDRTGHLHRDPLWDSNSRRESRDRSAPSAPWCPELPRQGPTPLPRPRLAVRAERSASASTGSRKSLVKCLARPAFTARGFTSSPATSTLATSRPYRSIPRIDGALFPKRQIPGDCFARWLKSYPRSGQSMPSKPHPHGTPVAQDGDRVAVDHRDDLPGKAVLRGGRNTPQDERKKRQVAHHRACCPQ